jgi:hypothetical protein
MPGLADYREEFTVPVTVSRPAREWARLILSRAPLGKRLTMIGAWLGLGVLLTPPFVPGAVLGWRIRAVSPDTIELGVHSLTGLTARIVWRTDGWVPAVVDFLVRSATRTPPP